MANHLQILWGIQSIPSVYSDTMLGGVTKSLDKLYLLVSSPICLLSVYQVTLQSSCWGVTCNIFSALSFSCNFDRGTYELSIHYGQHLWLMGHFEKITLNRSKQKLRAEKILQAPPQHLHYYQVTCQSLRVNVTALQCW